MTVKWIAYFNDDEKVAYFPTHGVGESTRVAAVEDLISACQHDAAVAAETIDRAQKELDLARSEMDLALSRAKVAYAELIEAQKEQDGQ